MIGSALPVTPRRMTRMVKVGNVAVGGGAPISVQSMTTTKTADVEGTLRQIYALAGAGVDLVRCTCNRRPVEEARAGRCLLESLGLRERKQVDLIACPSCGRAEIDVIKVANDAMAAFREREIPLQVAVMGCVVNGPGEAREADLGIAGGRKKGHLFAKGTTVAVVPEEEMVAELIRWAELIVTDGVQAALACADGAAAAEAAADRRVLLHIKGSDANRNGDRIDLVRKRVGARPGSK